MLSKISILNQCGMIRAKKTSELQMLINIVIRSWHLFDITKNEPIFALLFLKATKVDIKS